MNFIIFDIAFLILFALFVALFLYSRKKNLKKEGFLILYKTEWGIKLINYVGNRYKKTLNILEYISITIGYILMIVMFYFLGRIIYIYIAYPAIVRQIKIPPITPLVPYLPQIFKLDFLPPFYFIYWIIIIAIVAILHEFAHGIFAVYNKVRIKSTGFGFFPFFLPIFLAAFVELDEKQMSKKKIKSQLAVLSAGTFANVLTAIFFFIVMVAFFIFAFSPSGVIYDTYPYSTISISNISTINGINLSSTTYLQILTYTNSTGLNKMQANGINYVATKDFILQQQNNKGLITLYYDGPAIETGIENVILQINGNKVINIQDIEKELSKYHPGDKITLSLLNKDGMSYNKDIILDKNPNNNSKAWLGIGFSQQQSSGIIGTINNFISSFKNSNTYYNPTLGETSTFIYNLLWWLSIISISVALVNMLPVGIFDGGRFFYLTILAITKSKKKAKRFFSASTYLILFLILLLMLLWIYSFL